MNKSQQLITLTEEMGINESFATHLSSGLSSGMKKLTGMATAGAQRVKHAQIGTKAGNLLKKAKNVGGQAVQKTKTAVRGANTALPKVKPGGGLGLKTALVGTQALKKGKQLGQKFYQRGKQRLENPVQGPSKAGFLLNKVAGKGKELGKKARFQGAVLKQTVPFLAKEKIRQAGQTKAGQLLKKAGTATGSAVAKTAKATPGAIKKGVAAGAASVKPGLKKAGNVAGDISHEIQMRRRYTKKQHKKDQEYATQEG
jgi:hypothetical protein